jgi:hypothetical protein
MSRTVTAASLAALQGQRAEIVHLLALGFSGGVIRFTSGPNAVTWSGNSYSAAGSAMSFEAVAETPDPSGQRLKITLDGVSLGAVTALLTENYIGQTGTLRRGYLNSQGQIIADPMVLFTGYLNSPWDVTEDWDGRWCKVETELVSPLAVLWQVRGIRADPTSHQAIYSGDTFFTHILSKPEGDFGWGILANSGKVRQ